MGALFMFMILLAIVGAVSIKEEIGKARFEKNMNERHSIQNEWWNTVGDMALEMNAKDRVCSPSCFDDVRMEMREAYKEMPGRDPSTFPLLSDKDVVAFYGKGALNKQQRDYIVRWYQQEAVQIIMAKRGKIPRYPGEIPAGGADRVAMTRARVLWINKKLQEHGIYEDVWFEYGSSVVVPASWDIEADGFFFWKPMRGEH